VKPDDVESACAAMAAAGCDRVLSIAAGVTLARLEKALGGDVPVVRAMPNTPALVGAGAAAIAPGCSRERRRSVVGRVDPLGGRRGSCGSPRSCSTP